MSKVSHCFILNSCLFLFVLPVKAQAPNTVPPSTTSAGKSSSTWQRTSQPPPVIKHTAARPIDYDTPRTPLRSADEIPNLPHYPNTPTFDRGETQDLPNEKVYTAHFYIKDSQEQVFDWYKTTLSTGNWTTKSQDGNSSLLALSKDGDIANVSIARSSKPGFKSSVTIDIRETKQK